jgi:sulfate permease, SulP family
VPKLFGVEKGEGNFFEQFWHLLGELGSTSGLTLLVGLLSLALVVGLKETVPVVPGSLVAVMLGIAAVQLFDLDQHGVAIVGEIESGLPSLGLPESGFSDYLDLAPAAVGLMLIAFAEGLGAAKTYAAKEHYEIDPNRELIGLGAANLGSGLSSGMVVNGSLSKTAVNASADARSQLSGLVVAVLTVVTLLFFTGLFEQLPEASLAAVVVAALVELVDIRSLIDLYHFHTRGAGGVYGVAARPDFVAAVAALFGVLVFDTLPGLFIGIAVSLLLLLYRASRPHVALLGKAPGTQDQWTDLERHPQNEQAPGVVVLRPEAGLFFANADAVRKNVLESASEGVKAIVLDAETVPYIDVTAARMLAELAGDLERRGVALLLARDIGQVRDVLRRSEGEWLRERVYPTVEEAVSAALRGR